MAKNRKVFVCAECGTHHPSWAGRCNGCGGWATVAETSTEVPAKASKRASSGDLPALDDFTLSSSMPVPLGFSEVDSVLGGGLVPGSVTLLSGEPGIGKSTLSLQIAMHAAAPGAGVILVTGEEAPAQVAARGMRLGELPASLKVLDNTAMDDVVAVLETQRPQMVVVDSIQTMRASGADGSPGSITQVRSAAARLVDVAKRCTISVLIIGHVTKDGTLAGPRVLEHLVDTVLSFDGDRQNSLRFLRASKHRFGPTTDVGVFEMTGAGLVSIEDPSDHFLGDRWPDAIGSVVVPTLDGRRPLLVELQSLVSANSSGSGTHITAQGVPSGRVKQTIALASKYLDLHFGGTDVYVSAAGGATINEPGGDLAIALSLAGAHRGFRYPPDLVACAEVGLSGELRSVPNMDRRLHEAQRLGFHWAIVPPSAPTPPTGLKLIPAHTLEEAMQELRALAF